MATKVMDSTSWEVTLDAVEDHLIQVTALGKEDIKGVVAKITVTGGPVKFNATGAASDGRDVSNGETVNLTLFYPSFHALPTADTDSITVDL